MHSKIGDRVVAIESWKDGVLRLIGYGTYIGDEVPGEEAAGFCQLLREENIVNPCIELDDNRGKVYGAECWWGPVDEVQSRIEKSDPDIVFVSLDELRKQR